MPEQKTVYKGIEEHTFRSDDVHTLMDLVDAQIQSIHLHPESSGYVDYLNKLKDRLMAVWLEIRPGQEMFGTIREQKES